MGITGAERSLLAGMPLHAITALHGEAGLRERLEIEVLGFPAGERARVEDAAGLASRLHAGDRRQREPVAAAVSSPSACAPAAGG
jgi:hypothetical protein